MNRAIGVPILAGLFCLGCKVGREDVVATTRFQAVKASSDPSLHWCDSDFVKAPPRLTLPPLAPVRQGAVQPAVHRGRRTWLNLWATWCAPCLREIPLLLKWRDDLKKDGVEVDLLLLSLDDNADDLAKFLLGQKDIPSDSVARVASQRDYEEWLKTYMKDPSSPIPIHLLSSSDGLLRCIRTGSLREGDYPAAKAVLH